LLERVAAVDPEHHEVTAWLCSHTGSPPRKGRRRTPSAVSLGKRPQSPESLDSDHALVTNQMPCKRAEFSTEGSTTENRGVGGSSPPLAIEIPHEHWMLWSLVFRDSNPGAHEAFRVLPGRIH
jgi:hypothetical protein